MKNTGNNKKTKMSGKEKQAIKSMKIIEERQAQKAKIAQKTKAEKDKNMRKDQNDDKFKNPIFFRAILCGSIAFVLLVSVMIVIAFKGNTNADNKSSESGFDYSKGIDENGFWGNVTASDHIENLEYMELQIPRDTYEITDTDLQSAVDAVMAGYANEAAKIKDRAVADGDRVNIDYVGSVDGVEFDGGSTGGYGTDVMAGSTDYIDDFLTQIIGHMPGETFNVEVTFPESYDREDLEGKDAVFVTTINYIVGDSENGAPDEMTDEFVNENLSAEHGWTTVDEMEAAKMAELREAAITKYISDYLTMGILIDSIPDEIQKYQQESLVNYYKRDAASYQMEFEEYLAEYQEVADESALLEKYSEDILRNARYSLVIQAIAEDAEISVTDEDIEYYFSEHASYEQEYGHPYLVQNTLTQKVLQHVADNAVLE